MAVLAMALAKAPSFGKRGAPVPNRAAGLVAPSAPNSLDAAIATTESGVPLDVLARQLMSGARSDLKAQSDRPPPDGAVPWSWRAAFLAGLVASFSQAGLVVLQAQQVGSLIPGLSVQLGGAGQMVTPALIGLSLLSSGREAATTLVLSHFALRSFKIASPLAYAIGGAAAGAGSAYVARALMGGDDTIATEAMTGLIAGFLYRLLAGAKPA